WSRQLFGRNLTFPFITTNHLMRVNLRTLSTRYQNCKSAPSVGDPNKEFKENSSKTKRKGKKNKELVEELEKHDVTDKTSKILLEELWTHKTLAEKLSLKPPSPVGCWQDIEAYKPKVKSLNIEEYKKLHSRINRGFVVEQIREFLKNHGQPSKGNKDIMVDDIIQKIWEVPKPIEILQE
ncbi:9360_t:CDS:1, partial [Acaulospora morrowiae]